MNNLLDELESMQATYRRQRLLFWLILVLVVALPLIAVGACVQAQLDPIPTVAPIINPTSTATTFPNPTQTPLPPSATPTAFAYETPTLTPSPTATATPTLTPSPTPTPLPLPALLKLQSNQAGSIVDGSIIKRESLSLATVNAIVDGYLKAEQHPPSRYPVEVYRIQFRTRDRNGNEVMTHADLYIPVAAGETVFPLFVYGSGTTGIANECATLLEYENHRAWGNYRAHLAAYATQGYITAIANWQGFDNPDQTHPYFVAELEGYVMLDLTRAIYDFFADPPSGDILAKPADAVFFGGFSQGGHGAFAGDAIASIYAPELNILGVIGHATAPDVEGLMNDSPLYAPYIVYAYRDYYGQQIINPQDFFLEQWITDFDQNAAQCIDDALHFYPNTHDTMYTQRFKTALQNDQLATEFPEFKAMLDLNYSGRLVNPSTPALILHGSGDPIVQMRTVDPFVERLCEGYKNVTYRVYAGVHHFQTRQVSHIDTLTWMQDILSGYTPASECESILQQ